MKSGQATIFSKRYIYARQLSFLQTAGIKTETQSTFGGKQEELNKSEQITPQQKESDTPTYTQKLSKKRKNDDFETSLIHFMNTPKEINPDRLFFESVLPSISDFTEDQKLEFRCEVLNIIKRMRNSPGNLHMHIKLEHEF